MFDPNVITGIECPKEIHETFTLRVRGPIAKVHIRNIGRWETQVSEICLCQMTTFYRVDPDKHEPNRCALKYLARNQRGTRSL